METRKLWNAQMQLEEHILKIVINNSRSQNKCLKNNLGVAPGQKIQQKTPNNKLICRVVT